MSGRSFTAASAVCVGVLGQALFFAELNRAAVPSWAQITAHVGLILPLLFVGVAGRPRRRRSGRVLQAAVASAGVLYLGLSLDSVLLVLGGVRMFGVVYLLALEALGAAPAAVVALGAVRVVLRPRRPPPEPLFQRPWAGAYRTRPTVPREPAPPPARPRRHPVGHLLASTALAVGGAILACGADGGRDRFWGLLHVAFFGTGAWVFWEQLAAGAPGLVLPLRARRRALVVTFLAGIAAAYLGITADGVPIFGRGVAIGTGALMAAVGAWGMRKATGSQP
jgi:hypothetical protein